MERDVEINRKLSEALECLDNLWIQTSSDIFHVHNTYCRNTAAQKIPNFLQNYIISFHGSFSTIFNILRKGCRNKLYQKN